jgi:DAK2 domain fusion protein YloV
LLEPIPAVASKWLTCDGQQFRELVAAGLAWLDQNHQKVNALNVFPVPDGDTGTNMLLTMRSAYGRIKDSPETHVGRMAHELSQGALMGARGNSGVILSQIWRGLAKSLKDNATFNADDLAAALKEAADTAYKGVMRPVEGTILSVIRAGALEGKDAARKSQDLRFVLERVLERCQQALARTPDQLPILKQAGVVDSGGQGLVFILEGMLRQVHGEQMALTVTPTNNLPAQALAAPAEGLEFPYDVQFILMGQNLDVLAVREAIDAMGDSTVVVGDENTIKVHVHVKDPGMPISFGISLGTISDVVVENMQMQMEEIIAPHTMQLPPPLQPAQLVAGNGEAAELTIQPGQLAVVAVAPGDGLAEIFKSLGAAAIVKGGQTNNPSIEEILQAIESLPTDKVIVLPNNKNIILAAEAARELTGKEVTVIPSRTVPQGISALCAFNPDGETQPTIRLMESAARGVASGEITRATRSVTLDGIDVNEGEFIGLANGRLCSADTGLLAVLAQTLETMELDGRELLSVYYGQEISETEAKTIVAEIETLYPDIEVELLCGGQPHYLYILGAE